MNAAVPTQQSVITVKLVKRAGNRANNSSPSPDSDLDFSHCEKLPTSIHAERLVLAFRAHLPLTGSCLTDTSPLEDWVAQLRVSGLDLQFASAAIPSRDATDRYMNAHGLNLQQEPLASWAVWGLKAWIEDYKLSLSHLAIRLDQGFHDAITECDRLGASAPLSTWVKVWSQIGVTQAITYTLLGRGNAHISTDFSQCEKKDQAHPLLQVAVLLPYMRGDKHHYILSGHIVRASGQYRYRYQLKNKDAVPPLDLANLLSDHRLHQVNCDISMLPFSLFSQCEKTGHGRVGLEGLGNLSEFHVMGVNIRPTGFRPARSLQLEVLDVVDPADLNRFVNTPSASDAAQHRMPAIEPPTWMVDYADSSRHDSSLPAGVKLARPASAISSCWNHWLMSCREQSLGRVLTDRVFRTAKNPDGVTVMFGTAERFFMRTARSNVHARECDYRAVSLYRFPIAALVKHLAQQEADLAISLQGDLAVAECASALKLCATSLAAFLARPEACLSTLLRWVIFDCIAGVIDQAGFRYQVALQGHGYALAALPFWDLTTDGQASTSRIYGYRVVGQNLAERVLGDALLRDIAPSFFMTPAEAISYRDRAADVIGSSATGFIDSLQSVHGHLHATPDFRTAKNRAEHALARALLHSTSKGERHE